MRRAVFDATSATGDDVIVFDPSLAHSTINLTSGEIIVGSTSSDDALTISGPVSGKANSIIINANENSRIFNTYAQNLMNFTLENITLTGGATTNGGAIQAENIVLTLNDAVITDNNTTFRGGGIFSISTSSQITVNRSVISNNHTSGLTGGGGLDFFNGLVTLNNSLVTSNSAPKAGGIRASEVVMNQSTVSNNVAFYNPASPSSGAGGGISALNLIMYQSTLSGNTSDVQGSAWDKEGTTSGSTSLLVESTITNNTSGTGAAIHIKYGLGLTNISLNNSILSDNTASEGNFYAVTPANVALIGNLTLNVNHSIFGDDPVEVTGTSTGLYVSDAPNLGSLKNNGGLTPTHRPNTYSPAVNSGNNVLITEDYDQRGDGFSRIVDTTVDMGSVENQNLPASNIGEVLTRRDMAKAMLDEDPNNPPLNYATGMEYQDVQAIDAHANSIEKFKAELYSDGCEADRFCPDSVVSREEMAKIFLKVKGVANTPPTGSTFDDVPPGSFNVNAITLLRDLSYTAGCDTNKFCPKEPVTREWFEFLLSQL